MKSSYFLQQFRYFNPSSVLLRFSRTPSFKIICLDILHGSGVVPAYRLIDDNGNFIKHLDIGDLCKYNYFLYKTWVLKGVKDESVCFSVREGRRYK